MKNFLIFAACALALSAARPAAAEISVSAGIAIGQPVETITFRQRLSPYGRWVVTSYGEAWVPAGVAVGWRPYSDGRWVLTEYGWTFVSDDPWGWATWHFGNWVMAGSVGWVWVPGRVWAPAWVSWRYGGGYAAWAPIGPVGYRVVYGYNSPAWVVVQQQHFTQPIARVSISATVASSYVARAQPLASPVMASSMAVNPGPRPQAVASAVGRTIQPVAASAVVAHGTRSIAWAPRAPAAPAQVSSAMQRHWQAQSRQLAQAPRSNGAAQPGANKPQRRTPPPPPPRARVPRHRGRW